MTFRFRVSSRAFYELAATLFVARLVNKSESKHSGRFLPFERLRRCLR
jgi:hypothetical protein